MVQCRKQRRGQGGSGEGCAWFGQLFPSWSCLAGACVLCPTKLFPSINCNTNLRGGCARRHKGISEESNLISVSCRQLLFRRRLLIGGLLVPSWRAGSGAFLKDNGSHSPSAKCPTDHHRYQDGCIRRLKEINLI